MMKVDVSGQDLIVRDFKKLKVWQKAMLLSEKMYKIAKSFPKHEEYGMRSQVERASSSIALNIAEGQGFAGLFPQKEIFHYSLAKSSAYETRSQVELLFRIGYINMESYKELEKEVCEIIKMLTSLIYKKKAEID
jgi:four helix bundle protein